MLVRKLIAKNQLKAPQGGNDSSSQTHCLPCDKMRHPGIEPGALRWQRSILPLNQWRTDLNGGSPGSSDVDTGVSKGKTYITCDSRVVPHRSTEQAQWCLTSEFGWDPVLSPWYERTIRKRWVNAHEVDSTNGNQKWSLWGSNP